MNKIIIIAFLSLMMIGSVIAHNIDIDALKNMPQKKADGNKVYTTTKTCADVILIKSVWKNRRIISMQDYIQARHPHKIYCGIIYKSK